MKKAIIFLCFSLIATVRSYGQACSPLAICADAPLVCGFELNANSYDNNVPAGGGVPTSCGIEPFNTVWFKILPCSPTLELVFHTLSTQNGNGLQVALFENCMANGELLCNPGVLGGANLPLMLLGQVVPGHEYYLMVNGYGGDICGFTVDVLSGLDTNAPLPSSGGPFAGSIAGSAIDPCMGLTTGVFTATWPSCNSWTGGGFSCAKDFCVCVTWDLPPGAVLLGDPCAASVTIDFSGVQPGSYTLVATRECTCVVNLCDVCGPVCCPVTPATYPVSIGSSQIVTNLGVVSFCDTFWVCGQSFTQEGTFSEICSSSLGCDSTVIFTLKKDSICVFDCIGLNLPSAPGDDCNKAPFFCGNNLDNYCGSNTGLQDDNIGGVLLQNAGFIQFSPCSDTVVFLIGVSNCSGGSGMSFGLIEGSCGSSGMLFLEDILQNSFDTLVFSNLMPDSVYTLVIGGINDSECAFTIHPLAGIGTAEPAPQSCSCTGGGIEGPDIICPGDVAVFTLTAPDCFLTGGDPIGGNGYYCSPENVCPVADSLVLEWHIPSATYFIGDSTGLSISIGVDSSFFVRDSMLLDTFTLDSVWVSWQLVPKTTADSLMFCTCTGGACNGTILPKPVRIEHRIEYVFCNLTCINPTCEVAGQIFTSGGEYTIIVDNCLRIIVEVNDDGLFLLPPLVPSKTICEGNPAELTAINFQQDNMYLWSTGETGPSITVSPPITTLYSVTVTDNATGCTSESQTTVTVLPNIHTDAGQIGVLSCTMPCLTFMGITYCDPGDHTLFTSQCTSVSFSIGFDPFIYMETLPVVTICEGECYDFFGQSVCASATVTHEVSCTLFVQQIVVVPKITNNLGVVGAVTCSQPCVTFQGVTYCDPGIYSKQNGPCTTEIFEIEFQKDVTNMGTVGVLTCLVDCIDFEGTTYCQPGNFMFEDSCSIRKFSIGENIDTPKYSIPLPDCLPNNSQYTVTFSISGQPPFKVNGSPLAGINFLSVPISNDTQYTFIIQQANGCETVVTGSFDCSGLCINDAGVIAGTLLEGCSGQSTVVVESIIDPISGPGAIIEYWLVDAAGNVLQQNMSGEFAFDPGSMVSDETYFIRRVVGAPDSSGHPDLSNLCTDTTTMQPLVFHELPKSTTTGYPPICVGESNGVVVVESMGGADPILYALNNGSFGQEMVFDSLLPGDYSVQVLDANGCRSDTAFILSMADSLGLSIGPNLSISLGDAVSLIAMAMSAPVSINWWSDIGLSQMGGLKWMFEPPQSMQVTCAMVDSSGCTDTTSILITVMPKFKFDLPNAFTPNGDQANDVFKPVYQGDIFSAYHLTVYSRWGERVFETHVPGDGWDGSKSGKPLNSDVYVYVFEYEFRTGEKSAVRNELTLLR